MKRKAFRRAVRELAIFCSKGKLALLVVQVEDADRRDLAHQAQCAAELARELSCLSDKALASVAEGFDDRRDTIAVEAAHAARVARLTYVAAKELRRLTKATARLGPGR